MAGPSCCATADEKEDARRSGVWRLVEQREAGRLEGGGEQDSESGGGQGQTGLPGTKQWAYTWTEDRLH
jgi:hypothetical protein